MHSFDNLPLDDVLRADRVLDALLGALWMPPKLAVKLTLRNKTRRGKHVTVSAVAWREAARRGPGAARRCCVP